MATIVFLHAHPDDEASSTAGSIAAAVQRGDRVVIVYATNGIHGEVPDDLAPGETIIERRRAEALASATILGTQRVEWLGYDDSGMTGWDGNANPAAFCNADLDQAGQRLADILDEEDADVLVGYDWHGNYGHPDHVKVHPVTYRAAALAKRRPRVLESTQNRDISQKVFAEAMAAGLIPDSDRDFHEGADDGNPFGTPQNQIHWVVDIREQIPKKLAALRAHASQKTDIALLTGLGEELFAAMFGREYYREHGNPNGMVAGWPF